MAVETHLRRIVVWDTPPAVECGRRFSIKLGIKCAAECRADGWMLEVHDHDGNLRATTALADEPWPGTAALYYTQVELIAPDSEGLYAWQTVAPATAREAEHIETSASFNIRAVPPPEYRLTVVATTKQTQAPIKGAKVVVHPYRTVTDEHGIAHLSLPRGTYRLFVSGGGHLPFRSDGEVTADMTIVAELASDTGPSDADVWS
jgi:hypothetical protein